MVDYRMVPLKECVEEMFIGPFGSSLKNDCFVGKDNAFCMVYEQKHAIQKTMDVETRYVDEKKYLELKRFNIQGGDIIVSCRGTIGETFIVPDNAPLGIMHPSIMKIRLKEGVYDKDYFNALLQMRLKKHEAEANGSGVKMAISATELGNELFPLPAINEQKRISNILSKVRKVIDERCREICTFDELIKARFVEMFGDPRNNSHYEYVSFEELVEYMGDIGSNGANKVVTEHLDMTDEEDYALMVRFLNFTKNDFTDDVKYISKEAYEFFKKSQIFGGELIVCKIGSAGQNYVMPNLNRPVSLGLNQIMVRINNKVEMPYLYQYLHTEYGEHLISGCINGAVTKSITKTELKKIPVMLPPKAEQMQFVSFVEQVDKSKTVVQNSLVETQLLFDRLMQDYFGQ